MQCPFCKTENHMFARRCSLCDAFLSPELQPRDSSTALAISAFSEGDSDLESLYKAYIGKNNQSYYLYYFERFEREGRISLSWNPAAFWATLFWLMYRKMYRVAAIYFFMPFVVAFVSNILQQLFPMYSTVWLTFQALINVGLGFFVIPLYANGLYYRECRRQVRKVQASYAGLSEHCRQLAIRGGTSIKQVVFTILGIWLVTIVLALVMYSKFHYLIEMNKGLEPFFPELRV